MLLKKLIKNCPKKLSNIKLKDYLQTQEILKRVNFFAIKGSQNNGEKFVYHALKKGACAIISSKDMKKT